MTKYLVTGGAGFLGINLIRYLLGKGHEVTSLDIAEFEYSDCQDKIRIITGDIRDKNKVVEATRGADIVIHCAAALPLYKKADIYSTDIEGTRNVIEEAYRQDVERFIQISSTAVYGIPDHHPLLEEDTLNGVGPYGEAKIGAENICREFRTKGMHIPIIRPKSFIGPERLGVFALFYDWAMKGCDFPMIGSGNNRYQLLDVEDLCEFIYIVSTQNENLTNDTFNIGAKEFTTMKEDFQSVLDEANYGRVIRPLPATPIIWTLKFLEFLKLSPLYKWVYETASQESFVSIEKAEKILGFIPKYSNKDALLRNYRWYQDNIEKISDQSGISHRAPWKQGVLRLAKFWFCRNRN